MARSALEVADILRDHGPAWRDANSGHMSLDQLKVMSAIERCRTAALGGYVARCENATCGHTQIAYNSCRNRHCPKCQAAASRRWLADREAELLPAPYFHVVYTLPSELRDIAYENKRVVYDLLMKAAAETTLAIAPTGQARGLKAHDPKRLGARIGVTAGGTHAEPSLMMPGIIISLIFREQGKLVLRATPLQNQLASAPEAANNLANGFGIQLTAANFPRCPRRYLFAPQQTGLDQPFDRAVADATYSRSLAQTNSFRIRQGSLLTGNGMVAPGGRHASLIPSHPFARRIAAAVQHRGNLVVAVANGHTTNDLQRLHRRGGFRCGARPLHRELRMYTSLPVNYQLKGLFLLVSAHDDLFDRCAEDHLLECRRTVVTLPDSRKVITHRTYCGFLFGR